MQQWVICEEASAWPTRNENDTFIHVARAGAEDEDLPVPPQELTGDAFYVDAFIHAIPQSGLEGQVKEL